MTYVPGTERERAWNGHNIVCDVDVDTATNHTVSIMRCTHLCLFPTICSTSGSLALSESPTHEHARTSPPPCDISKPSIWNSLVQRIRM